MSHLDQFRSRPRGPRRTPEGTLASRARVAILARWWPGSEEGRGGAKAGLIRSPICPLAPWGPGPDGRWWKGVEAATGGSAEASRGRAWGGGVAPPSPSSCFQQPHLSLPRHPPRAGGTEAGAKQLVRSAGKRAGGGERRPGKCTGRLHATQRPLCRPQGLDPIRRAALALGLTRPSPAPLPGQPPVSH